MLTLIDIHKSFGKNNVLQGIDFKALPGQIHTIVGGNGAGKTTLLNIITGYLKAEHGQIIFNHKHIHNVSPITINQLGVSRTFQDLRLAKNLSVKENILLAFKNNKAENLVRALMPQRFSKSQVIRMEKQADELLHQINLIHVKDHLADEISYGQQKLLTIGCCIANNAQLLILDEPIAGIDAKNYERMLSLLRQLKDQGKTIIQIEHNLEFIREISDQITFLYNGKAKSFDSYVQFSNSPIVKTFYLN